MPETQLMIRAWSLVHACVATVASLTEEMIGMSKWYLAISGKDLANYLHSLAYSR